MFKQNFIHLCNQKGVSPSVACRDVGITPAAFSCWTDASVPRKATLARIADYFGVSIDYLLGKEKPAATGVKMFKENFVRLCNQRGVAPTSVCTAIGLQKSAFSNWDETSVPRQSTLIKIADYFGVSVDYLLGKEQKEKPAAESDPLILSDMEKQIILSYRAQPNMQESVCRLLGLENKT